MVAPHSQHQPIAPKQQRSLPFQDGHPVAREDVWQEEVFLVQHLRLDPRGLRRSAGKAQEGERVDVKIHSAGDRRQKLDQNQKERKEK